MKDKQKLKDKLKEALDSLNTIRSEEWYVTLTKEEIEHLLNNNNAEYNKLKEDARKKAVALHDILNYSEYGPALQSNQYYKNMKEMMDLVLTLTNDIDLSRLEDNKV